MSETSDPSEEPKAGASSGPEPDAPDLLATRAPLGSDDDTPVVGATDGGEAEPGPGMSKDSQRLMIAVAILVVGAIAAIGIGIARRGSNDTASTTNTTVASTATTAAGGKSSTTKAGDTNTTKATGGGCQSGSWPKSYTAKPDAAALKAAGIHVWNDNPGWKIRVVDPNAPGYKIEVVASLAFDPKAVKAVGGATMDVKDNKTTIELPGGTEAAGIDFGLPCAVDQFTVGIVSQGAIVSPDLITVGKDAHAVGNPIIVMKVRS